MLQKSCIVLPCTPGTSQRPLVGVKNQDGRVWAEKYVWKVVCSVSLRRWKTSRFHAHVTCQVLALLQHCWGELNCCCFPALCRNVNTPRASGGTSFLPKALNHLWMSLRVPVLRLSLCTTFLHSPEPAFKSPQALNDHHPLKLHLHLPVPGRPRENLHPSQYPTARKNTANIVLFLQRQGGKAVSLLAQII